MLATFNKCQIVHTYIFNGIIKFAKKHNFEPYESFILITKDVINNKIQILFSNRANDSHEVTFEDIFSPEALIG